MILIPFSPYKHVLPATIYKTGATRPWPQDTLSRVLNTIQASNVCYKALDRIHGKSWYFFCTVQHTAVFGIQLLLSELPNLPTESTIRKYLRIRNVWPPIFRSILYFDHIEFKCPCYCYVLTRKHFLYAETFGGSAYAIQI